MASGMVPMSHGMMMGPPMHTNMMMMHMHQVICPHERWTNACLHVRMAQAFASKINMIHGNIRAFEPTTRRFHCLETNLSSRP